MAAMYEQDLANSTEIVLTRRNRVKSSGAPAPQARPRHAAAGSANRAAAGALSVGSALGAALTNRRLLGPAESGLLVKLAVAALVLAALALWWPRLLAMAAGDRRRLAGGGDAGKAWTLRRRRRRERPGPQARGRAGQGCAGGPPIAPASIRGDGIMRATRP